jgi:PAS domain S-box-containing protein
METESDLRAENTELKARLAEAEQTLEAIRSGEVDALVVAGSDGDQVFTLKGAEMPYRILVEEMNQGALLIAPDGTIIYANTRFAALSKTPLEQVIGSSWKQFFPGDKHPELKAWRRTASPTSTMEEINLQTSDGAACPVHLAFHTMNACGVEGFSVIVTDLTERKQAEDGLRKVSEELFEKNTALEAFSYIVSHDMRAPLRAMQGMVAILLESYADKLDDDGKSYLGRIESSTLRLDRLIQDVLAYSKLSSVQHKIVAFDLDKMMREMVETYPNLAAAKIEIVASAAQVRGHEVVLGQCVSNLLGNALKFVPPGRVPSVKVWTEATNGKLRVWIQDNGIGIRSEDQARIFEVFTRLHGDRQYEGTGLGLSMVKKAMEKMGGHVGVESELGQGSRFWIELQRA